MSAHFSTRHSMPLSPGSIWRGSQRSGSHEYDVEIRICSVDELGDISGTLTIRNLTPNLPKLVTFFNGEIIGPHHTFATEKWEATEQDDDTHWKRFGLELPSCYPWSDNPDAFNRVDVAFLRLKERCILNDADKNDTFLSDLSGASFSGFYYIALELNSFSSVVANSTGEERSTLSTSRSRPPTPSTTMDEHRVRPMAPQLTRSGSYASVVVRGRSPSPPPHGSSFSSISKSEDEHLNVSVTAIPASASFLSDEEYPLPCSPTASVSSARHSDFFGQARSDRAHERRRGRSRSSSQSSTSTDSSTASSTSCLSMSPPTAGHNSATGYRGPWANAIMRGFYFASTSEPFQELKLHYVGDGMGLIREELEDDEQATYGHQGADPHFRVGKELVRRRVYSALRGSASFEIM